MEGMTSVEPAAYGGVGVGLDLVRSVRRLRKDRAFTIAVVLTLGICLSANAVIFTIVNRVLLNPLPGIPEASSIMLMANQFPNAGVGVGETSAPRNYYDRLEGVSAFVEQSLFGYSDQTVTQGDQAARVRGLAATPSLFGLLAVDTFLGRTFTEDEGEIGNEDKVILSYGLWQEVYGGDPAAIGADLIVGGRPFTVVGVMPKGFTFFDPEVRLWIPLTFSPIDRLNAGNNNWYNIGRLAPGATVQQAQAQVDAVNAEFLEQAPRLRRAFLEAGYHTTVRPLEDVLAGRASRVVYLLWGAALVILLIGGVNAANLGMVRLRVGSSELVTCMALGASRLRLAGVLMAESVFLAAAGGALGLLLGIGALRLVGIHFGRWLSLEGLALGPPVVAFVLGLSVLTGVLAAVPAAKLLTDVNLGSELHASSRGGTKSRGSGRLRRGLIVAQVGLTFVLLMAAALFLLTLRNLTAVDPGFATSDSVTTAKLDLSSDRYVARGKARSHDYVRGPAVEQFIGSALARIRSLPGVLSAAATTAIPLDGGGTQAAVPEGRDLRAEESIVAPTWVRITPRFFETIGTPLTRGRDFEDGDLRDFDDRPPSDSGVVIVDETLARRFWPSENPIGKRMFLPGIRNGLEVGEHTRWLTVVGVVPAQRFHDLSGREPSVGVMFTPYTEANPADFPRRFGLVVKSAAGTRMDIDALRKRLASIDPEVAVYDGQTMRDRMRASLGRQRLAIWLGGGFALAALFMAAIGLYGVVSYSVVQRTRELGIRLALGSNPSAILKLVLLDAAGIVAVGLAAGLGAFWILRPALASQVYGIATVEPVVVVVVSLTLGGIGILASAVPARRASLLQPTVALKDN
jgi:putative ABC transport system permease protein